MEGRRESSGANRRFNGSGREPRGRALPPIERHFAAILSYVAHTATRPSLPALPARHLRRPARITHLRS
ncbi:MAG: hypothetical protein U0R52_07865 [Solirubrobacterales bacterium]